MGTFIFIVIVGLLIWLAVAAAKAKAAKQALKDAFLGSHGGWDAYVTPDLEQVIAIDHDERRIAIGPLTDPIEVAWADVASCEVERNGQSITATNRGSQVMGAAVGGLLLGPAGLLLGGLTGSKRNVEKVAELSLKIMIDHRAAPLHRIIFAKLPGDGVNPNRPCSNRSSSGSNISTRCLRMRSEVKTERGLGRRLNQPWRKAQAIKSSAYGPCIRVGH